MDDRTERLLEAGHAIVATVLRGGADAADVAVAQSRSRAVQVRHGRVEETESSESDSVSLRVFVDGRVATVSTDLNSDPARAAERAIAMARVSPVDPYASLADDDRLARDFPDLDLFDPTEISSAQLTDDAHALEAAALAVDGIGNSGGASASVGLGGLVLVTSGGFSGVRSRSAFSRSVSAIAGDGTGMQRDYDFDSRIHFDTLEAAETIGRRAGERAVARLDPQKLRTGRYPVVFDPRVARGFIGHLLSAINGAAIARGTSFLKDDLGKPVLPDGMSLTDDPLIPGRWGSRTFDGEGVGGASLALVEGGVLRHWLLDTATGRELGLPTNGRAVRGGGGVSPSSTNVIVSPGEASPAALLAEAEGGIYVTELIGHGADLVTGDYSRGASGFRIRNGALAEPVDEFTIAGNMRPMFRALRAANDGDTRFSIVCPTLSLGELMVAGS